MHMDMDMHMDMHMDGMGLQSHILGGSPPCLQVVSCTR